MDSGLVSAIIPTYEDGEYLARALRSVSSQTYDPIEAIVVDSAGSARVRELVDRYPFATYVYDPPKGVAAARNRGIEASDGEYIALLDADDEWFSTKTARQVRRLEEKGADFVFSQEYWEDGGILELRPGLSLLDDHKPPHVAYFARGGGIGSRTVLFRRECFEVERFWEALEGHEDPNLWVRLLAEFRATKVEAPLAVKHRRDDSLSSDMVMMGRNEQQSIAMLIDRYPELEPYASERRRRAMYTCAKGHLSDGNAKAARKCLRTVGHRDVAGRVDVRVPILLLVSVLPFGCDRAFERLRRVYAFVQ